MWGIQGRIDAYRSAAPVALSPYQLVSTSVSVPWYLAKSNIHLLHPSLTPQISWLIGPQFGIAHLQGVYNNFIVSCDRAYPYLMIEHGSCTHLLSDPHLHGTHHKFPT
jgi:hypothetical protein